MENKSERFTLCCSCWSSSALEWPVSFSGPFDRDHFEAFHMEFRLVHCAVATTGKIAAKQIWNVRLTQYFYSIPFLNVPNFFRYITVGCDAMKLILKNFGSVIKSNIDSPIQTVGVDISREERYTKLHQFYFSIFTYLFFYFFLFTYRHNKCMECYKDLVKIRSLILKRQAMQGKLGHTFRELSILMQYLD